MNKEEAILELMSKIYSNNWMPITIKEKKYLEERYKTTYSNYDTVEAFMESDEKISCIIQKLKSGRNEIDKQLKSRKSLQPGILSECICAQTISRILGLQSYLDTETNLNELPIEILDKIKSKSKTINASRYVYYKKNNPDGDVIVQYGNPEAGDGSIWYMNEEIIIEIKQLPALMNEIELIYNDEGKINFCNDNDKEKNPEYENIISLFNERNNFFNIVGTNYKIFSNPDCIDRNIYLNNYFSSSSIDLIIILNSIKGKKDFELIALKPSDINIKTKDNKYVIDVSGSEIRTCGKNYKVGIFTPVYFNRIKEKYNIQETKEEYIVSKNEIKLITGRGKTEITKIKIDSLFLVRIEDVIERDNYFIFKKNKLKQQKSNMSIHVEIHVDKKELKKLLMER